MNVIPHPSWLKLIFIDGGRFALWDGPRALWKGAKRHPKLWVVFLALVGLTALLGPAARWVVYAPVLLVPWAVLHHASFRRWVVQPARSDWRRHVRYQRRWPDVMSLNRLSIPIDNALDVHPEIVKARTTDWSRTWHWSWRWPLLSSVATCTDLLWVRTLISDEPADYQERAPTIARDYGARVGRAFDHHGKPKGCVRLEITYGPDPLAAMIPALPIPASADDIDFSAVPVGRTEKGEPWTIDLSLHVLLAGATGSGKSGVLQQLIRSLAPAIRDGLVVVHAVDPKFGLELGPIEKMCAYYEDREPYQMADLLHAAVGMMPAAARSLKDEGLRKIEPTLDRPLHLIVVDEMIDLTDPRGPDKKLAEQVRADLGFLLRKGRASGFIVVGAVTDPRVEAIPMRDGFPMRIGLRLATAQQTKMILGDGARQRGALCEDIGEHEQGVAYVLRKGAADAQRVRAAYVTTADIAAMVAEYAPGPQAVPDPAAPEFDFESTAEDDDVPVLELVQGDMTSDEGWE